jgi:peptidyl-prolyl cis-trans isomerase D
MVKPFSDSCFLGNTGEVKLVYSQFGLHIVKIEKQSRPVKKVQIGTLAREVRASEETDQTFFAQASEFGALYNTPTKFNQAIADNKGVALSAMNLRDDANNINDLENSRQLVRWAFEAQVGDVTPKVMQFGNKYVVAILDDVKEEGYAPVEKVRTAIEIEVRKQKQAEKLLAKLSESTGSSNDLNAIANDLGTNVKEANNVRFTSYSIPGLGVEPKLQAVAVELEQDAVSQPIDGNNGVYVIQVNTKDLPSEGADNSGAKNYLTRSYTTRVNYSSVRVLNELAGVEDNRINFF